MTADDRRAALTWATEQGMAPHGRLTNDAVLAWLDSPKVVTK